MIGSGFALFTAGDQAAWTSAANRVAATLGMEVTVHALGDDGAAHTRLGAGGALLVRPDDFVGWRTESLPSDPESTLRQSLSVILDR